MCAAILAAAALGAPANAAPQAELVAVLPFSVSNTRLEENARELLLESIRTRAADRLAPAGFTVLTNDTMLTVLADNGIDPTQACEASCVMDAARHLKASLFMSGIISTVEGVHTLILRLNNSETGRQLSGLTVEGRTARELLDAFDKRSASLFEAAFTTVSIADVPPGAKVTLEGETIARSVSKHPVRGRVVSVTVGGGCFEEQTKEFELLRFKDNPLALTYTPRLVELHVPVRDLAGDDVAADVYVTAAATDGGARNRRTTQTAKVGVAPGPFRVPACAELIEVRAPRYSAKSAPGPGPDAKDGAVLPFELSSIDGSNAAKRFAVRAGLATSTGVIGLGVEARPVKWLGLQVGYGTNFTAGVSVSRSLAKGGLYGDAHFALGTRKDRFDVETQELGGGVTVGYDLRPLPWLSLKAGLGVAYSPQNADSARPRFLVFDAAAGAVF